MEFPVLGSVEVRIGERAVSLGGPKQRAHDAFAMGPVCGAITGALILRPDEERRLRGRRWSVISS